MKEPSYAMQLAVRSLLVASPDFTSLVPAPNVIDKNDRPEVFPAVIIGEGQTLPGGLIDRSDYQVILDLHVWTKEAGLKDVKAIAHAVRGALATFPRSVDGFTVADIQILSVHYLRDPSGAYAHGVVTIEARLTG